MMGGGHSAFSPKFGPGNDDLRMIKFLISLFVVASGVGSYERDGED